MNDELDTKEHDGEGNDIDEPTLENDTMRGGLIVHILICIVGIAIILMLLSKSEENTTNYDHPSSSETPGMQSDIKMGASTNGSANSLPHEEDENNTHTKEQHVRETYEQMRKVINNQEIQ